MLCVGVIIEYLEYVTEYKNVQYTNINMHRVCALL